MSAAAAITLTPTLSRRGRGGSQTPHLRRFREGSPLRNSPYVTVGAPPPVVPVETGTHPLPPLDSRLRGNDGYARVSEGREPIPGRVHDRLNHASDA